MHSYCFTKIEVLAFHQDVKRNVIDACFKDVKFAVVDCNIISKEELMAATISEPIE